MPWMGDVPNTSPTNMSCNGLGGGVSLVIRSVISILMALGVAGVVIEDPPSGLDGEDAMRLCVGRAGGRRAAVGEWVASGEGPF